MLLEGLQLSRYRLLRLLGSGGMGEVYLGEDTHIHRQVAIKVIRAEATPYPNTEAAKESNRLFQREVRAIATLDHPHVLPLFDYGEENLNGAILTYMVMPYRPDGSLSTWLREHSGPQPLPAQNVARMIGQAATALSYAHRHHIIHQDVKPSNFLIRIDEDDPNAPDLLLADFGIAKFTGASASISQSSRGTPTYMAPEQWSAQPVPATDQYALAIMAYQLLTGSPPFQGRQEQVMYMHLNAQPQPPSTLNPRIPREVDAVLLHAMAKKPEERFASISEFARAFQQAIQPAASPQPSATRTLNIPPPTIDDLRATLAISKEEAQTGTIRILNLPGGRQIRVPVPSGIPDGQIIRLEGQGEVSSTGQTGALVIKITVAPLAETVLVAPAAKGEDKTYLSERKRTEAAGSLPSTIRSSKTTRSSRGLPGRKGKAAVIIGLVLLLLMVSSSIFYFKYDNLLQKNSLLSAAIPDPYPPNTGTLALNDPLSDNSNGNFWGESSETNGSCSFTGEKYHINVLQTNIYFACTSRVSNFSNFVYEVQMTIVQGDRGGIIFRSDGNNFYYFRIGNDGTYSLDIYKDNSDQHTLISSSNSAINIGHNQSNLIAAVANGSNIVLYVNNQRIDSVTDSAFSQGQIGVAASDNSHLTEVVFSNAKVWTF